jgi:hypothetical protein
MELVLTKNVNYALGVPSKIRQKCASGELLHTRRKGMVSIRKLPERTGKRRKINRLQSPIFRRDVRAIFALILRNICGGTHHL